MSGSIIRIPRTTAMFVNGLARILREEFGLPIYEHEDWTLQHVAHWETCGRRGECSDHGMSEKYQRQIHQAFAEGDSALGMSLEMTWCYPFETDVYVGAGRASMTYQIGQNKVELRTRITKHHWDAGGTYFEAEVWARKPDGEIVCGKFYLHESGRVSRTDSDCPPNPPSRLAFGKSLNLDDAPAPA